MSNTNVLYVKGMKMDDSEADTEEDIWDDSKLNDAYDKALRMANMEVAQRIAMATNSKSGETSKSNQTKKTSKQSVQKQATQQKKAVKKDSGVQWKEGMPCRAVYYEDGFEYEAIVLSIIDDNECVIRFLGYNNTEIVPLSLLQTTLGKEARKRQIEEVTSATKKKDDDGFESQSDFAENGLSDEMPRATVNTESRRTKNKKSKNRQPSLNIDDFSLPTAPMPDAGMLGDCCPLDMPVPPPLLGSRLPRLGEDEALSAMLLSWYMSGYHTGLYQGMRRARSNQV
ncbi:survival motor neuron protein [Epargyreus clarus]|uniref:survival motor neuron protein n=1 Tax=Epargyreus clarus TaxID=520877 RepID=UPI003C2FE398